MAKKKSKSTRKAAKRPAKKKASTKRAKKRATKKRSTKKRSTKKGSGKKAAGKKVARKKPAKKKSAKKKPAKKKSKTPRRKTAKKKTAGTAKPATKRTRRKTKVKGKLGRPRIPGDAKIDSVFRKEYDARQICEFLGVETLRELEKYTPDEIVNEMTRPIVQTVGKIRKILAVANRSLASDEAFAIEFRELYGRPDDE